MLRRALEVRAWFLAAALALLGAATGRATETFVQTPEAGKSALDSAHTPARAFLKEIWYDQRDAFNGITILDEGNWIEMNGSMYRVVSTSRSDEEILFLCIEDIPAAYMYLNGRWSPGEESSQTRSVSRTRVLPELSPEIRSMFALESPSLDRIFLDREFGAASFEPEIASPPPKIA